MGGCEADPRDDGRQLRGTRREGWRKRGRLYQSTGANAVPRLRRLPTVLVGICNIAWALGG